MREHLQFYIDGRWTAPAAPKQLDVINPATEEVVGRISLGDTADVDKAVAAARHNSDRACPARHRSRPRRRPA